MREHDMTEERITTYETPDQTQPSTSHTTIIRDEGSRSGGSGWVIAAVLILALVAGFYFMTQMSGSEAAKNNAIAGAASEVGDAAQSVGDAAGEAGQAVENAADKIAN
jgi:uncharacterized protein HemX